MCIVGGQFTGGVHPSIPEIVSHLPCSPALVRHILPIVYFFKELISVISSLDKCHTGVFNALILFVITGYDQSCANDVLYVDPGKDATFFCKIVTVHSFNKGDIMIDKTVGSMKEWKPVDSRR